MPDYLGRDTGQQIDADGNITYEFEGKVLAEGLDLPAGTNEAASNESRIRWVRESDGAAVAQHLGYKGGATTRAVSIAGLGEAGELAQNVLEADGGGGLASLFVSSSAASGRSVTVTARNVSTTVINEDWESSFLKIAGVLQDLQVRVGRKTFFDWGISSSDGFAAPINILPWWPNEHVMFLGSAWPGSTWTGFAAVGATENGLGQGVVQVRNTAAVQVAITCNWISFGY